LGVVSFCILNVSFTIIFCFHHFVFFFVSFPFLSFFGC
jgi:hypothetical protein